MAKPIEIIFHIKDVDLTNEDGKNRQDLLAEYSKKMEYVTFRFNEVKESGKLVKVEVLINEELVGEVSTEELELFDNNFYNATKAKLNIYQELLEDDSVYYSVEVNIHVPYIGNGEKKKSNKKTRISSAIIIDIILMVVGLMAVKNNDMGTVTFCGIGMVFIIFWSFIKSDSKYAQKISLIKPKANKNK